MTPEPNRFNNHAITLSGTLYKPDTAAPHPCLIVLHSASEPLRTDPFYHHLITHLPAHGIAVLLFDRRGSGESGGIFETADFKDLASDALVAFDLLQTHADINPHKIFVYGISQGGWIAPIAAARQSKIAGVVIVSGSGVSPARQMDYSASYTLAEAGFDEQTIAQAVALRQRVNEYFRGNLSHNALQTEIAQVQNAPWFESAYIWDSASLPLDVTTSKWYYEMDFDPLAIWRDVHQPALFIFPAHDRWVPIAESIAAYQSATTHLPDVTFQQIPNADHLMHNDETVGQEIVSDVYLQTLLEWLTSHQTK